MAIEILPLLETDATKRDDSLSRPAEYEPGVLYVWPIDDDLTEGGDSSLDDGIFRVAVAWATDAEQEHADLERHRATALLIKARRDLVREWIRTHRTAATFGGTSYDDLQLRRVSYLELFTHRTRGFLATLEAQQWHSATA